VFGSEAKGATLPTEIPPIEFSGIVKDDARSVGGRFTAISLTDAVVVVERGVAGTPGRPESLTITLNEYPEGNDSKLSPTVEAIEIRPEESMAKMPSAFELGSIEKVSPAPTLSSGSETDNAVPTNEPTVAFSKMVKVESNEDMPGCGEKVVLKTGRSFKFPIEITTSLWLDALGEPLSSTRIRSVYDDATSKSRAAVAAPALVRSS